MEPTTITAFLSAIINNDLITTKKYITQYPELLNIQIGFSFISSNTTENALNLLELISSLSGDRMKMFFLLQPKNLDPHALMHHTRSSLYTALLFQKYDICEHIIKQQPSILTSRFQNGDDILIHIIKNIRTKKHLVLRSCQFLLSHGIKLDAMNHNQETALMHAASRGLIEVCKAILTQSPETFYQYDRNKNHVLSWLFRSKNIDLDSEIQIFYIFLEYINTKILTIYNNHYFTPLILALNKKDQYMQKNPMEGYRYGISVLKPMKQMFSNLDHKKPIQYDFNGHLNIDETKAFKSWIENTIQNPGTSEHAHQCSYMICPISLELIEKPLFFRFNNRLYGFEKDYFVRYCYSKVDQIISELIDASIAFTIPIAYRSSEKKVMAKRFINKIIPITHPVDKSLELTVLKIDITVIDIVETTPISSDPPLSKLTFFPSIISSRKIKLLNPLPKTNLFFLKSHVARDLSILHFHYSHSKKTQTTEPTSSAKTFDPQSVVIDDQITNKIRSYLDVSIFNEPLISTTTAKVRKRKFDHE